MVTGEGSWRLTRFGRAVVGDDPVRASYEGFGGFHTELYRDLPALLRGGPRRRDTAENGEVIARLAEAIYPLVRDLLVRTVTERRPRRVLDIHTALAAGHPGALTDPIDLALLANVIYYVPVDERVELLRAVARLLVPGGALVVVTTVAGPQLFSRHLDLLLRAQEGRMELPAVDVLAGQLREAGLQPHPLERIGPPGAALGAVTAVR